MAQTISRLGPSLCLQNGVVEDIRFLMVVLSHSTGPKNDFRLLKSSKWTQCVVAQSVCVTCDITTS